MNVFEFDHRLLWTKRFSKAGDSSTIGFGFRPSSCESSSSSRAERAQAQQRKRELYGLFIFLILIRFDSIVRYSGISVPGIYKLIQELVILVLCTKGVLCHNTVLSKSNR